VTSDSFQAQLIERAAVAGLALGASTVSAIDAYYNLLRHWNKRINLTSLALDPIGPEGLDRLFVEPLAAAGYVPISAIDWIDLGSGGGSPAFPIRIARSAARLTLVESRARKAAFLREVVRELKLADVEVLNDRFERIASRGERRASADLITIRAVRIDDAVAETARHILRDHGLMMLFSTSVKESTMEIPGLVQSRRVPLTADGGTELLIFQRR
jgi:16S rRNA (guanine527-N7)-methyltransferase